MVFHGVFAGQRGEGAEVGVFAVAEAEGGGDGVRDDCGGGGVQEGELRGWGVMVQEDDEGGCGGRGRE